MNGRLRAGRQSGALLLMVALLLATMAALSFGLNRAAGMDAASVQSTYDARAAGYLAEAAVAAATWSNQAAGCKNASVSVTAFGTGSFAAEVKKAPSKRLNIVATGSVGADTVRTIERREVPMTERGKQPASTDRGGAAVDKTISAAGQPASDSATLVLSNQSHALLYWPVTSLPGDDRIESATLILTQSGTSATSREIGVHRMKTAWDASATWTRAKAGSGWTGGDFAAIPVAMAAIDSASKVSWDVTSLVQGWATGRLANNGILLRLVDPNQSVTFHSLDGASGLRPILRVVTAKAC